MAIKRVNLTLPLIIEEIDNILVLENPDYQQVYTPKFIQDLISYVFQRVSIRYKLINEQQEASLIANFLYPLEECLHIEEIINQGVSELLVQPVCNQPKAVVANVS